MASKANFDELGEVVKHSGRAIAAVLDGRTIGVAGYYLDKGRVVLYSTITHELRAHRRTIVQGARIIMGMALNVEAPAAALAEPETAGSETLLKHFGFEPVERDVYWRPPWRRQVH